VWWCGVWRSCDVDVDCCVVVGDVVVVEYGVICID